MHGSFMKKMDKYEARLILGLNSTRDQTKEQVSTAYQRVYGINNPEEGGSTLLAFKVRQARDLLLKESI